MGSSLLSDGGETGGYDPPPRQQRQIWFWLNLIGTKEKKIGIASPYFHNSYICIKIMLITSP